MKKQPPMKNKDFPAAVIAQIAPQGSAPNTVVPFLSRPEVKELLQKVGISTEEQRRLKEVIDSDKSQRVEELYKCFQLAVDTALVSYYGEEPAEWLDGYLGAIYDELVNVPRGA